MSASSGAFRSTIVIAFRTEGVGNRWIACYYEVLDYCDCLLVRSEGALSTKEIHQQKESGKRVPKKKMKKQLKPCVSVSGEGEKVSNPYMCVRA